MDHKQFQKNTSNEANIEGSITNVVINTGSATLCPIIQDATTDAICVRTPTDTGDRLSIIGNGTIEFGPGNGTMDVKVLRQGANTILISSDASTGDGVLLLGAVKSLGSTGTHRAFEVAQPADTNRRIIITSAGKIGFGPGSSATLQVLSNANGYLALANNESDETGGEFRSDVVVGNTRVTAPTITTASGDLTINPAGSNVNLSNKNLIGVLSLRTPTITTASGDLVLNPTGPNVDFSGKNIINAVLPSSSLTFPISYTTGTGTNKFLTVNQTGDSYERWSVDADGMHNFGPGGAALLADLWVYRNGVGELLVSGQPKSNGIKNGTLAVNNIRGTDGLYLYSSNSDIYLNGNELRGGRIAELESIQSPPGKLYLELNPNDSILYGKPFVSGSSSFGALDPVFSATYTGAANTTLVMRPTEIGLGVATTAIGCYLRATATNTLTLTTTSGGTTPGTSNFRSGTVSCNSVVSLSNNLAINPQGSGPVYQNTNSGCLLLGHSGTFNNCTRVILIGSNRQATNCTGNVIFTDGNAPTAGTPGVDNNFECRFSSGYWLATNTANSTGLQMSGGGSTWSAVSDARTKAIHRTLNANSKKGSLAASSLLDSLAKFELYEYHYLDDENSSTVVGPTTQSFYGAFGEHLGKTAETREYTGAFDEGGNCVSNCLKPGDKIELLSERDEKTAMWLCIKELHSELESVRADNSGLRSANNDLRDEVEKLKTDNSQLKVDFAVLRKALNGVISKVNSMKV